MTTYTYELEISGEGSEVSWISLSDKQVAYWKKQNNEKLLSYILTSPDDRHDEYSSVPKHAEIDGYWEEIADICRGYGPKKGSTCILYKFSKNGKRSEIWSCDIEEIKTNNQKSKNLVENAKVNAKQGYLIVNTIGEGSFTYCWTKLDSEPTPKDFKAEWSPDKLIMLDIKCFGDHADSNDISCDCSGYEARIISSTK